MKLRNFWLLIFLTLAAPNLSTNTLAQGTAFHYQGRLGENGKAANGSYDLQFSVFEGSSAATPLAPAQIVTATTVTNGAFAVTLDFGPGIFTGPERWLEIAVRTNGAAGFTTVTPRQPITPAPYAIFAATASNVVNGAAVRSVNGATDQVTLAAGSNVTIVPTGNTLTISAFGTGSGGASVWSLTGGNAVFTAGNVGIGTATPHHRLSIAGGPLWTTNGWHGDLELENASAIAWQANAAGKRFGIGHSTAGFYLFRTASDPATTGASADYDLMVDDSGNVGLGTITPSSKLEIAAQDGLKITGFNPFITLRDSNAANARSVLQSVGGGLNLLTENYLSSANPFAFAHLDNNGNFGIGTATPQAKLEVASTGGDIFHLIGYEPYLTLYDSNHGYKKGAIQQADGGINLFANSYLSGANLLASVSLNDAGNVGIGTVNPQAKLDVNGAIRAKSITLTGGADVAEPFPLSNAKLDPGTVVIIDDEHPGRLKQSTDPYDRRVAGIISGANGVNPGLSLQQEGAFENGQNVALSGRVYVKADASYGAIRPGDLLTTSETAGHAMRVADHQRAHGAILGKAMDRLDSGKGLVLVLVTLQ